MPLPKGRSAKYMIWRVCERFSIDPPGIEKSFDINTSWQQAQLIAYEQLREVEEWQQSSVKLG